MRHVFMALGLLLALTVASDADSEQPPFVPTSDYTTRTVNGWNVHVNKHLLEDRADLGRDALRLLDVLLFEVERAVPETALGELRKVPIWLGLNDGHAPCAEYHPSRSWLLENGYNPDKARGVEIGNAERFLSWSKTQPSMLLHELAHAYHDRVLGFGHPEVRSAFRRAKESDLYNSVLHANGGSKRAYALTNPQEFFAESSEAYFGTNDFYPFVRVELHKHDPETARLLEKLWNRPAE
ncbi:MAG TPA: hypothetical protein VFT74_21475 [Isosphaeraceae bacterium]|nr:hypothetical protein [Isosphaeraceae bacterium]